MSLRFTKMHGLGNDFAVLDARTQSFPGDPALIRRMGDRQRGIGFDQLLTLHAPMRRDCVASWRIWNRDGTRAEQCGNGLRCVAAWLARAGEIAFGEEAWLEGAEVSGVRVHALDDIEVDLGEPCFGAEATGCSGAAEAGSCVLRIDNAPLRCVLVSMGNPHAVVEVEDLSAPALERLGPALTTHASFAHGVNAGFAQVLDRTCVRLRVHERGAGWTAACGSGAAAAMAALRLAGRVDAETAVALPGGVLRLRWPGPGHALHMRGPAAFVYEGEWLDDSRA